MDCENNFYKVLKSANKIVCLQCEKQISGTNSFNIKRHYKLVHKKDITQNLNESDDECAPTKERKNEEDVKINIESEDEGAPIKKRKFEEDVKINNDKSHFLKCVEDVKTNDDKSQFLKCVDGENDFYKVLKSADKIVCLECEKEISGTNTFNIKRHYKLIHKKDISKNSNESDDEGGSTKNRIIEENVKNDIESEDEGAPTKERKIEEDVKINDDKSQFLKCVDGENDFYKVLKSANKIVCLECEKEICGTNTFNIKRHYKLIHKKDISKNSKESDDEGGSTKNRIIEENVKNDIESEDEGAPTKKRKVEEDVKINDDKSQFLKCVDGENDFYKVLKSANKIVCLECEKEISGTNTFNIKRHYKLVHKKDISKNLNESDDEGGSTKNWIIKENVKNDIESEDEGAPTKKRKVEEDVKINDDKSQFLKCVDGENDFYKVLKSANKIVCLECEKEISGTNTFNIKRHYKLVHKKDISKNLNESDDEGGSTKNWIIKENVKNDIESEDEGAPTKKRKVEEDVKINDDKSQFLKCVDGENDFYKVLKSANKIVCLKCEKEISGTNTFNIKRHYKLIHKKDISKNSNESDDECGSTKNRIIEENVKNDIESEDEGAPTKERKIEEDVKLNADKSQFLKCVDGENNFYKVLKSARKIVCLQCEKQISGTNSFNIKRHYKLVHKKNITQNSNESDDECAPTKKKKIEEDVEINTEYHYKGTPTKKRKIEENVKINIDKSQFSKCIDGENNFYKVLKSANKIVCLECEKEVNGTNSFNIKRHYKLVHKKDIAQNPNESDDESVSTKNRKIVEDVDSNIESDDEGEPTKKRKIEEDVKIIIDKSQFLKRCVGLVVVKNLPFRIFDDSDFFKDLISPYENKFKTNLNSKNIFDVIEVCYVKIQQIVTKRVKNKMLSIQFYTACLMDKRFLGINIQYIKDFKIYNNTIGMIQLKKGLTAVYIKEEILSCLKMYQIDIGQIYSSTNDNGANLLKVSQILQKLRNEKFNEEGSDGDSSGPGDNDESIHKTLAISLSVGRCPTQTIQLSANDVLHKLSEQISECRDAYKQLRKVVKSEDINMKMPTLDNATQWNSTYEMFLSLLHARDNIDPLNTEKDTIPDINWEFINHFVAAFKPLALLTKQLRKEQYVIGDFYRDWLCCEIELEDLFSVTPFSSLLHSSMQNRRKLLFNNNAFLAALYLDPRFNFESSTFLSEQQKCQATEHLMKSFDVMITLGKKPQANFNEMNFASCSSVIRNEIPTTYAFVKLEQRAIAERTSTPSSERSRRSFKKKLKLLENNEKLPFDTDVLNYWKTSGDNDLKSLVEIALAIPASQVSVERAFSALSEVLYKLRPKLSSKTLNNLLITKLNFNELNGENIFFDANKNVNIKTNEKY